MTTLSPAIPMHAEHPATTPCPAPRTSAFPFLRASAVMAAVVVVLALVTHLLTRYLLAMPEAGRLNLIGAVTCGGAGLLGLVPVWLLSRRAGMQGAAMGFLLGMLIRMGLGAAVVIGAAALGDPQARVLGFWVVGWYLVVLTTEVILLSSYLRSASAALATRHDPPRPASQRPTETDR